VLIFILTTIPSNALPSIGVSDKFEHFGAYFVLTILVWFYFHFKKNFNFQTRQQILGLLILTTGYSIFDEVHQLFIPGRYFDLLDLAANFIGILAGFFVANYIIKANSEKSA
jgi:VanZ family protein